MISMCYSVGSIVWVDAVAGESVPGYSLEPEMTPEQMAAADRIIFGEDD